MLSFDASEAYALRKIFEDKGVTFTKHIEQTYHQINKDCWKKFESNELTMAQLKPLRMELTLKALQLDFDPVQFAESYHDRLGETDFFVPGAKELIESLAPDYQLVLITNGIEKVQQARLKNTGLDSFFPTIVISESIGVSKPNVGFFDYTFEQIKHPLKDQVLVIGDGLGSDIKGGNNYGVDTCWHNFKGIKNTSDIRPTYEIATIADLSTILK